MFKGKSVDKHKYISSRNYVGLNITIDIYGIATKDALSLNREELTSYASQIINHDLYDVIGLYMDLLSEKKEEIMNNSELVDSYFLSAWLYDKQFPEDLYKYISDNKNIYAITYNKELSKYEDTNISLSDVAKDYPKLSYCDYEHDSFLNNSQRKIALTDLIDTLNNSEINRENYNCIIIDKTLKEYLELTFCDYTYIPCEKDVCIRTANTSDTLYSPDEYTRKTLIKNLVHAEIKGVQTSSMYVMRRAIHAFNEYKNLATKLERIFFLGGDRAAQWYIISPISLNDAPKVKELSKEAFTDYIMNKDLIDNIVLYVLKNAKDKSISKEIIIKEYKRLIFEYYDICTDNKSTE